MNHIIESQQFSSEFLFNLFKRADSLRNFCDAEISSREEFSEISDLKSLNKTQKVFSECLKGKIMASLFYEPSTRTRLSFESAMLRLGGKVIGTENAGEFSSAVKGESLEDTIRIISKYCDCIVIRHSEEGAAKQASEVSKVPIINGGDGKGQHPTQAILDVYTIYREFGRLENLKIAMVGDLSSGRTVRSLCYLLGKFKDIEIIFVSPENLKMKEDIKEYLREKGIEFREEEDLNKVLREVDVVYMTRIQKERISLEDYNKAKGKYVINKDNFNLIKEGSIVMHPLPHIEEIELSLEVEENDKRVAYFREAENGLYIRMALLDMLLNKS